MRGAIFAGEAPLEPCPLDFGWFVERRPMAGVLRRGEFRVAGRMADARHGRLIRIEGREWPPNPARTVVCIAEERGFLPVRVERYVPNSRTPLTVLETVRTQKPGNVWFPVAVRQETRYAGTQTTELTTTDVRVNDVDDSLFAVAWTKPGDVWNNGTNTSLRIDPGGQLSLDPRMGRLGVRFDRPMLLRMGVVAVLFLTLSIMVWGAVRMLRQTTRLIGS